jgi:hypothetical protein
VKITRRDPTISPAITALRLIQRIQHSPRKAGSSCADRLRVNDDTIAVVIGRKLASRAAMK